MRRTEPHRFVPSARQHQAETSTPRAGANRHNVSPWRPGRADRRGTAGLPGPAAKPCATALLPAATGISPSGLEAALLTGVGDPGQGELFTVLP